MEEKNTQTVVDYFEIPEDLAKELSELLVKQTIRQGSLIAVIDQPDKYEAAEKLLIPVTRRIEAIKIIITKQYVPEKYNSQNYMWNYDGWDIDQNKVQVIKVS